MKSNLYRIGILSTVLVSLITFGVQVVSAQQSQTPAIKLPSIKPKPTKLGARIFFGSSLGGRVPGKCSNVTVKVTNSENKVVIEQPAQGKDFDDYCLTLLENVPVNTPITLTAQYSDIVSTPSYLHLPPRNEWSNPFTLAPGSFETKHLLIDGKPVPKLSSKSKPAESNVKEAGSPTILLKSCKRSDTTVKCYFTVTSKKAGQFDIMASSNAIVDTEGKGKSYAGSSVDTNDISGDGFAISIIMKPEVNYTLVLTFKNVPKQLTTIPYLKISYEFKYEYPDVPISN